MTRRATWLVSLLAIFANAGLASAQGVPLSELLVNLIQSDVRLEPPPPGFVSHEAHFLPGFDQQLAPYLFNQQFVQQLATFPIGSPAGGFAYSFNTASGTFERSSNSFGPSFADRALTNGRQKLTFGVNFQRSKYTNFEGNKLDTGDVKFYLDHQDVPGDNFFEGDVVQVALRLNVTSNTTTLFANYGLTDALDMAVVVPIVSVKMDAAADASILRLATGQATTNIHAFAGGASSRTFTSSGSATGIGDILIRGKYRFLASPGGGLAANVDLRLPTGDETELLGTGAASATFTLIGSTSQGRVAPHFNVSYKATGESAVVFANEFGYKVGTELVASPTVTLSADLIGRSLIDAGRLELADRVRTFRSSTGTPGSVTLQEYALRDGALNLTSLALGGRINVGSNFLINANLLLAIGNAGITAPITPVIGFDFTF